MCILHTFWACSRSTGICQCYHSLLVSRLSFEACPPFVALQLIVFQAIQNRIIKWSTQLALCSICIRVDKQRDMGVSFPEFV